MHQTNQPHLLAKAVIIVTGLLGGHCEVESFILTLLIFLRAIRVSEKFQHPEGQDSNGSDHSTARGPYFFLHDQSGGSSTRDSNAP